MGIALICLSLMTTVGRSNEKNNSALLSSFYIENVRSEHVNDEGAHHEHADHSVSTSR